MAKEKESDKKTGKGGASASYSAKDIYVLEGLEPVRKRPGMYIGSTGVDGLHHLIWEVVDNSIDEAMAGFCTDIEVSILPGEKIRVADNGRGIPVDIHPQTKKSALETALCTLHAGGKFGGDSYKVSGGLHGVGVSVVNALSIYVSAKVHKDKGIYFQEYSKGKPKAKVKKIGKSDSNGTIITFRPDEEIFKEVKFNFTTIMDHLRQQCYLTKGVRIKICDMRGLEEKQIPADYDGLFISPAVDEFFPSHTFYFEGGLVSYIKFLNREEEEILHENVYYVSKEQDNISVEIAGQYSNDIQGKEMSFANNIYTPEGGMHTTGFRSALTRVLNDFAKKGEFMKKDDENLSGDDVREGLTVIISVKLREPQFEGQTKAKLGNPEARGAVETVAGESLQEFLEKNPQDARKVIEKCLLAQRARKAAKAAKETVLRKGVLEGFALSGKLADCSSKDFEESEIFIVEGDSAGGSAKQGRDRRFQAILPLRGKILNIEKARLDKMLANKEIRSLVIAMGTSIGQDFDLEKLRYNRIVLMTDADVDGSHIRTLLLTLFYRYFPTVITGGHLYIAQPPLYKIQKGKSIYYAYNDEEKESTLLLIKKEKQEKVKERSAKQAKAEGEAVEEVVEGEEVVSIGGVNIQRYKGLGEMSAQQLWETTMDPGRRVLKQVTVKDASEADKIFDILMGEEVLPRKRFIQAQAKTVQNLDI
jgi:DNA gyrase subunit B